MTTITVQSLCKSPACLVPSTLSRTHQHKLLRRISPEEPKWLSCGEATHLGKKKKSRGRRGGGGIVCGAILPVDPWAPNIDSQSIASQLFAISLFPYIGFLYFITKSKSAPRLTLFGFYFLLTFVGATIPAGIYAKVQYGTSLSNVDWLHGGAESFLTLTNLFIVMGLREAHRNARDEEQEDNEASI